MCVIISETLYAELKESLKALSPQKKEDSSWDYLHEVNKFPGDMTVSFGSHLSVFEQKRLEEIFQ